MQAVAVSLGRLLTLGFGLISVIGVLWFTDSLDDVVINSTTVSVIAAFVVSMSPERLYRNKRAAPILLVFCAAGIVSVAVVIVHDVLRFGFLNRTAVFYQIAFIVGFVLMTREIVAAYKRA